MSFHQANVDQQFYPGVPSSTKNLKDEKLKIVYMCHVPVNKYTRTQPPSNGKGYLNISQKANIADNARL